MRYDSESAQVKLMISGNSVVFEDTKNSFGAFHFCTEKIRLNFVEIATSSFSSRHNPLSTPFLNPEFQAKVNS